MYNVLDVAIYVINYAHDTGCGESMSNLKLQKILYYIQVAFLLKKNKECFKAVIIAGEFGPVIPEVYQKYKIYGRRGIPKQENRKVLQLDCEANETPLQVLHEAGRRAQTKSYMWLFRSGEDDGPPIILYKYSETRSGNTAAEFLDGFHGYLMCDGYSGYNKVPDIKRTACWAHIRRYLTDAVPQGKKLDYNQPAVQGILYIELFRLEEDIKAKHTTFDAVRTHNFAYVFKHISEKTGCSATARIE